MPFTLQAQAQLPGTWIYRPTERFREAQHVHIVDSAKYIVGGGSLSNDSITTLLRTQDSGLSWELVEDTHWPPHLGLVTDVEMTTATEGYFVGMNGLLKHTSNTGANWDHILLSGIGGYRHYRAIDFKNQNLGLIVGGNQKSNPQLADSLQTIVRTTDSGNTWSYVRDAQGPWLRDIAFAPNSSTVVAVGDSNVILRSTDDGLTWTNIASPLTASRVLNAVWFNTQQSGYAVGGMPGSFWSPDSMTTILHTTDAGLTWSVTMDRSGSMLNDVHFYSNANGFAVGDHNLVLATYDAGAEWTEILVAPAFQDDYSMYCVRFTSPYVGIIVGERGKCLFYKDLNEQGPTVTQMPVVILDANTAKVQAKVNAYGHPTLVQIFYGTTPALGTTATVLPGNCHNFDLTTQSAILTGLQPLQLYYYKVEAGNTKGTASVTGQFRTTTAPQPNFDFEFWNTITTEALSDWNVLGSATKVQGSCDASDAAEIQAIAGAGTPGAIVYGTPNGSTSQNWSGLPFVTRPDSLTACLRYNIANGDTARIRLRLTATFGLVADTVYKITGTTSGNFQTQSFQIRYLEAFNPDTMLLAIMSTNESGLLNPASTIAIDNILFPNSITLPNHDFQAWQNQSRQIPDSWYSQDDASTRSTFSVTQGPDKVHGDYSLKLANLPSAYGYLKSGTSLANPKFPVASQFLMLNGHLLWHGEGNDSLHATVKMFQAGSEVGTGNQHFTASTLQLQPFSIPIVYPNQTAIPDSCSIVLQIHNAAHAHHPSASYAIFDALAFDGLVLEADETTPPTPVDALELYPNPAHKTLNVRFPLQRPSTASIKIYDLIGKEVFAWEGLSLSPGQPTIQLDLGALPAGNYILKAQIQKQLHTRKLILLE